MSKTGDKIAIYLSVGILLFASGAYITDSYAMGGAVGALGMAAAVLCGRALPKRKGYAGYADFAKTLLLEGKGTVNEYLQRIYPAAEIYGEEEYLTTDGRHVLNAIGYGKAGEEWAAKLYRKYKGQRLPFVLAAVEVDRKALSILSTVASEIKVLHPKDIYRKLKKSDVEIAAPPKAKLGWRLWLSTLRYRHAWLFAMVASSCIFFSLWSPVKVYYYVSAAINAALAIGVLVVKRWVKG